MKLEINNEFSNPPSEKAVARFDHCPCFSGRQSLVEIYQVCWFCKYSDFDIFSGEANEERLCRYPNDTRGDKQ